MNQKLNRNDIMEMSDERVMNSLDLHKDEYYENIYQEYTEEELMWWILNLVRRSTHRCKREKALKDLDDAKNYLEMLVELYEDEDYFDE